MLDENGLPISVATKYLEFDVVKALQRTSRSAADPYAYQWLSQRLGFPGTPPLFAQRIISQVLYDLG
jgi:hypothetical protein